MNKSKDDVELVASAHPLIYKSENSNKAEVCLNIIDSQSY